MPRILLPSVNAASLHSLPDPGRKALPSDVLSAVFPVDAVVRGAVAPVAVGFVWQGWITRDTLGSTQRS